jgi:O-antigen ligase
MILNNKNLIDSIIYSPLYWILSLSVISVSVILLATSYYHFSVLPSIAIISVFIIARYPAAGYFLLVFLFPFRDYTAVYSLQSLGSVSPQKLIGVWLFIVLFFIFILKRDQKINIKSNLWMFLGLFFVLSLVSGVVSDYRATSFQSLFKLITPFIIFLLTLAFLNLQGLRRTLPKVIIASVIVSFIITLIRTFFTVGSMGAFQQTFFDVGPKAYSILLIFPLPLLAHQCFFTQRFRNRVMILMLTAACALGVTLTHSRAGTTIVIISFILIAVMYGRRFKPRYLGIILSLVLVALTITLIAVPFTYWTHMARSIGQSSTDSSFVSRASYLKVGMESVRKNPVIGTGPGTFKDIYKKTGYALKRARIFGKGESLERRAHNTYIEVLVGTGILGLLFYSAIIIAAHRNFYQARRNFLHKGRLEMGSLTGAYWISYTAMLIYMLFITEMFHHYFWISIAVSQLALRYSEGNDVELFSESDNPDRQNLTSYNNNYA